MNLVVVPKNLLESSRARYKEKKVKLNEKMEELGWLILETKYGCRIKLFQIGGLVGGAALMLVTAAMILRH